MSMIVPRARRVSVGDASVSLEGIEVTQAVQNLKHHVPLIAGKRTFVRVYLRPSGVTRTLKVRGELLVGQVPDQAGRFVPSIDTVSLRPDASHPSLHDQRRSFTDSLNFLLPAEAVVAEGTLSVTLNRITTLDGRDLAMTPRPLPLQGLALVAAPPLRVHCIGLRYQFNGAGVSPQPIHFDRLRSFLGRAYPVASVEWTQIVIDADPRLVPPFSDHKGADRDPVWENLLAIAHQQLATIRAADMKSGADPRTHYYGLIADDAEFFRGAAVAVPDTPRPDTVAVGPAGRPGSGFWDQDMSYADWYGAHEIAHTFGRFHPGFCGQSSDDRNFPYPDGRISDDAGDFVGFDVGDPDQLLPPGPLPHETYHDVMTYCDYQWVSLYTYKGILDRLAAEDAQFAPRVA